MARLGVAGLGVGCMAVAPGRSSRRRWPDARGARSASGTHYNTLVGFSGSKFGLTGVNSRVNITSLVIFEPMLSYVPLKQTYVMYCQP